MKRPAPHLEDVVIRLRGRLAQVELDRDQWRNAALTAPSPNVAVLQAMIIHLQCERDALAEALAREIELHQEKATV